VSNIIIVTLKSLDMKYDNRHSENIALKNLDMKHDNPKKIVTNPVQIQKMTGSNVKNNSRVKEKKNLNNHANSNSKNNWRVKENLNNYVNSNNK
jgi:hypothetical protein